MNQKQTDLICLSHLRWAFVYQRPQHLMSRAARGQRVFFFEEPHFDAETARLDISRCATSGVYVATPHMPWNEDESVRTSELKRLIDDMRSSHSIEMPVLWYYTPMAIPFSRHIAGAVTVYDCMDELAAFRFAPPALRECERELFERADVVFTGGQSLYESKKNQHANVHAFPSSVDVPHFRQARTLTEEPADQSQIARPRAGFCGVVDERFDVELLRGIAGARPDWQFVIVGPVVKIDPSTLPQAANIHYLGGKSYQELPSYLSGWDVSMLLFAHNESTRFISPTKTPEYLAAGSPPISTSIRDVVRPYGEQGVAIIADTVEEFAAALDKAHAFREDAEWHKRTEALLSANSWDLTWNRMSDQIEAARNKAQSGVLAELASERPSDLVSSVRRAKPEKEVFDYLIVGAGFAGSVIAERLARKYGQRVLICDKRPHIAGNAYDFYNEHGVLVHKYGPHIFHTNSKEVFDYLSMFTQWRPFEHKVLAHVDEKLVPVPINLDTVNQLFGLRLETAEEVEEFFASRAEQVAQVRTSEDVVVSRVGRELYEKMFRGYTRKQWGLDPSQLDAQVTARIPVRTNRDDRYFGDTYQVMPKHGYTRMFENMLDHPNIKILLNTDYHEAQHYIPHRELVFTGPVDEYFGYRFGKLPYRSLEFKHETLEKEIFQSAPVVNYPSESVPYTRITEFKYLTGQQHRQTSIVYEFPRAEGDPYYPVPRPENAALYKKYQSLADVTAGVHFVGRLATYKYYNMDQIVAQALTVVGKMQGAKRVEVSNGHSKFGGELLSPLATR